MQIELRRLLQIGNSVFDCVSLADRSYLGALGDVQVFFSVDDCRKCQSLHAKVLHGSRLGAVRLACDFGFDERAQNPSPCWGWRLPFDVGRSPVFVVCRLHNGVLTVDAQKWRWSTEAACPVLHLSALHLPERRTTVLEQVRKSARRIELPALPR